MKPNQLKAVWVQRITEVEADERFPPAFAKVEITRLPVSTDVTLCV